MKILALELAGKIISGYLSKDDLYIKFHVNTDNDNKIINMFEKNEYDSIEHFAGVIGKFDPYVVFLKQGVEVTGLNFEELRNIILKLG